MTICPAVGRLIAHAGGGAAPDQHGRRSFDDDVRRPYANGGIAHTRCGHIPDKDMRAAGRKYRPAHMRNRWEPRRLHGTHMHISNARCWRHGPSSFTPIRRVADNAFSLHHTGRSQPLVDFHQTALDLKHCARAECPLGISLDVDHHSLLSQFRLRGNGKVCRRGNFHTLLCRELRLGGL